MKKIVYFLLINTLLGCTKEKPKVTVIKNDIITEEYEYRIGEKKDTLFEGIAKIYYPNGKLKRLELYKNNRLNGEIISYDTNGVLSEKETWQKGTRWGKATYYYPNGKVESEGFWRDTLTFGLTKFYYTNGKYKQFDILDLHEKIIWNIEWDSLGHKLVDEGQVIGDDISIGVSDSKATKETGKCNCHFSSDSISMGEKAVFSFTIACLPDTKQEISTKIFKGNHLLSEKKGEVELESCSASFAHTFHEKGKYNVRIIGELWDNKSNLIQKDSVTKKVIVY